MWASRLLADSASRTFHPLTEWGAPKLETGFWGKDKDKTELTTLVQSTEEPQSQVKGNKGGSVTTPLPKKHTSSAKQQTETAQYLTKNYDQAEHFLGKQV